MFLWRATLGAPRRGGRPVGEQAAEFGVGVFAEPFMSRNEQPPHGPGHGGPRCRFGPGGDLVTLLFAADHVTGSAT